ncbi:acyltransferase [Streptomyces sp. MST-110588]|uniref:acyltransferase family protein n=1 Tax=Streptomyces sp. MST-110588 TaxID=2833628 RepID=UPI001F5D3631|nr:acyltransferase [Streptomyces sp. MST-110588]UNO38717.1 acyltransferase [Streptomyces sp. MST-110588]
MPPPAAFVRLPSLTGLRFVAAFGVFVCHVATSEAARTGTWPSPVLFLLGPVCVSVFFVLSGFVLTLSARETDTVRGFWRRRIVKIYPNHLVVWATIMVLVRGIGMPTHGVHPTVLGDLANALLVHTLIPLPGFGLAGNSVAWSLTCELLFYLLFPLLLPLVTRIRTKGLPAAALIAAVAVWAVPLSMLGIDGPLLEHGPLPGKVSMTQMALVYMFPPCRLPEFLLGMVLARMHMNGFRVRVGVTASAGLLCAALFLGVAVLPAPFLPAAATVVPVALLIRATAALDTQGRRSLLRTPGAVFLGDLSYAFYLEHATVIAALLYYADGLGNAYWVACVAFPVALAAAWLLHTLIERPCMRRLTTGRPRSLPATATAPGLLAED